MTVDIQKTTTSTGSTKLNIELKKDPDDSWEYILLPNNDIPIPVTGVRLTIRRKAETLAEQIAGNTQRLNAIFQSGKGILSIIQEIGQTLKDTYAKNTSFVETELTLKRISTDELGETPMKGEHAAEAEYCWVVTQTLWGENETTIAIPVPKAKNYSASACTLFSKENPVPELWHGVPAHEDKHFGRVVLFTAENTKRRPELSIWALSYHDEAMHVTAEWMPVTRIRVKSYNTKDWVEILGEKLDEMLQELLEILGYEVTLDELIDGIDVPPELAEKVQTTLKDRLFGVVVEEI